MFCFSAVSRQKGHQLQWCCPAHLIHFVKPCRDLILPVLSRFFWDAAENMLCRNYWISFIDSFAHQILVGHLICRMDHIISCSKLLLSTYQYNMVGPMLGTRKAEKALL